MGLGASSGCLGHVHCGGGSHPRTQQDWGRMVDKHGRAGEGQNGGGQGRAGWEVR